MVENLTSTRDMVSLEGGNLYQSLEDKPKSSEVGVLQETKEKCKE